MKRLYINPITRTIEPKYRSQKAVYISKGDHNSTLLRFEIPKMVDGFDMSEATIQIHYANISSDGLNTSKGMTNAKEVNKEDSPLTFAWEIPKTATRYAGVLSIGITFERYEGIDDKSEEIYSWSTAPYGEIVVCDSYDNSAEVAEREHDYLVETCNAIVLASLEENLKSIYEQALNKATGEATTQAKGHRDWAETYANESYESALLSESYAKGGTGKREGESTNNALYYCGRAEAHSQTASKAESNAKKYKDEVETAKKAVETAKSEVETAKSEVETAKSEVETAKSEVEAAKSEVEAAKSEVEAAKSEVEAIQNEVSENTMYSQTYRDEAKGFKNEAESFKNEAEGFMIQASEHSGNAWNYANECEAVYNKLLKALELKVSGKGVVRLEDVNTGINTAKVECSSSVTMYGKNLTPYDVKNWVVSGNDALCPLDIPACNVVITLWRSAINGTFDLRRYKPDGTYEGYERFFNATSGGLKNNIPVPYREGYTYKIKTTKSALELIGEGTLNVWFQVEVGSSSEYEEYKEPKTLTNLNNVELYSPTATLIAESLDTSITATYTKDINKTIERLENAIANS